MTSAFASYHPLAAARREMRRRWGVETSAKLGKLLLINAVQAGLRVADGNKYRPLSDWLEADSSETRARIRLLLPEFLQIAAAADAEPEIADLVDQPWEQIWHNPLTASQLALALLPNSKQAQLTHAVNQLRNGDVVPARDNLQTALSKASLRPGQRSRFQRNLAACYEVLGDDEGAHWFAERAVELCPWNESNLLSYLIYSVIAPDVGKRLPKMERICRTYPQPFPAQSTWSILAHYGGRASIALQADEDLAQDLRKVILNLT